MNEKKYRTALYLRLSKEDGDKTESDSISNQRLLIMDYLKDRKEFCVVDEFVDDGYSGSNFERPAFKRMYEDLESGAINCIIVKDLSRLGRNYIEMGRYLEQIFPVLGVRLIAINDHYDGESAWKHNDNLIVPIKNLMNDAYCRDISVKIKSQLTAKRKRGDYVGNYAPYGYKKDPDNKSKLIIDEKTAENVRQIFKWKIEGMTVEGIAEKLNQMEIASPLEYKLQSGESISDHFRKGTYAKWAIKSVLRILHNEIYTGSLVQGKHKKVDYRSKEIVRVSKDKWVRVENTHEAIIDRRTYDMVQELIQKDTRVSPDKEELYLFSGYIECGDCHNSMVKRVAHSKGKKYSYYICASYKKDKSCSTHNISCDQFYEAVFQIIKKQIALIVDADELIEKLDELPIKKQRTVALDVQITGIEEEIERYKKIKAKLYEDYREEILEKEEYTEYVAMYGKKISEKQQAVRKLKRKRSNILLEQENNEWISVFKKYRNIEELNRPMLVELIDKILVYEDHRIEVIFKYQDVMQSLINSLENVQSMIAKEA